MKSKLIIYSLALSVLGATSCKKFLDREPISAATDENFWKTEQEGNSAVAGGYALLRQALTDGYAYYVYGDLPTEQFRTDVGGEDFADISTFKWNTSIPSTSTWRPLYKLRRYDNFYRVIDQASRCIHFVPLIPAAGYSSPETMEANRDALVGEGYFLRAFTYFYMARVWGAVPIVTVPVTSKLGESLELPRSAEVDVLKFARDDVKKAIELLPWGYVNASNKAVRANKGAAYALLAHLEAWAGDYTAAAAAAGEVIDKGGYQMVPMANYLSIWKGQSSEGIFEISANSNTEGSALSIATLTLKAPYLATYTGQAAAAQLDPQELYEKFPDSTDGRIVNAFAFYNSTDPNCIKYSNIIYLGTDANGNRSNPLAQNNIVIFRLSDIKLLKAEALAATNQFGEAKTLLNEIRTRARPGNVYAGTDANLYDSIMVERSRELFLEGHRFYDLVRQGRHSKVYDFGGGRMNETDFKAGKYYWPLEPTLMSTNPKLLQTPFWQDKM